MSKKLQKILDKQVFVQTFEKITLEELVQKISGIVEHDDVPTFIALLEKSYQSWEVTEICINHFDAVKEIYKSEVPEDERELKPKNLLKQC